MDKRYQIFISSTFADLEEERKAIMEAIMNLNCFPAGMEMFPASDSQQFEYIKTIIDESDYYILVVAGRYGSEADDGISYTQKEFEYAREKGIPVLVFAKKNVDSLPVNKTDQDEKKKDKLNAFREIAMKNRLAKYWDDYKDLKYEVHDSLSKIFKMNPRTGWVKGNIENNEQLLQQLNITRQECDKLKMELEDIKENNKSESKDNINTLITFHYDNDVTEDYTNEIDVNLNEVFVHLGKILENRAGMHISDFEKNVASLISEKCPDEYKVYLNPDDVFKLLVKLQRANYIVKTNSVIKLTKNGREVLFDLVLDE